MLQADVAPVESARFVVSSSHHVESVPRATTAATRSRRRPAQTSCASGCATYRAGVLEKEASSFLARAAHLRAARHQMQHAVHSGRPARDRGSPARPSMPVPRHTSRSASRPLPTPLNRDSRWLVGLRCGRIVGEPRARATRCCWPRRGLGRDSAGLQSRAATELARAFPVVLWVQGELNGGPRFPAR